MDYLLCGLPVKYTSYELSKFGVYGIQCRVNSKIYIGSTITAFRERIGEHIRFLNKNLHVNKKLQNAWNKYGHTYFDFIIIEIVDEKGSVLIAEQKYIDKYKNNIYNICLVAGNTAGILQSKENINKKSKDWVFVSPEGIVIFTRNLREFCRQNKLKQRHMCGVANRKEKHHRKWLAYTKDTFSIEVLKDDLLKIAPRRFKLISPNGETYVTNRLKQFAIENNLNYCSLFNTLIGQGGRKKHKGWFIQELPKHIPNIVIKER